MIWHLVTAVLSLGCCPQRIRLQTTGYPGFGNGLPLRLPPPTPSDVYLCKLFGDVVLKVTKMVVLFQLIRMTRSSVLCPDVPQIGYQMVINNLRLWDVEIPEEYEGLPYS